MNDSDLVNFLSSGFKSAYTLVPVMVIYWKKDEVICCSKDEEINNNYYNTVTSHQVSDLSIQNKISRKQKINSTSSMLRLRSPD